MKEAINNFIKLLVKGDFFLVFLLVMIVVVILVILYLIKLEISTRNQDDEDEDEDLYDNINLYVNSKEEQKEDIDEEEIDGEATIEIPVVLDNKPIYESEEKNTFENPASKEEVEPIIVEDSKVEEAPIEMEESATKEEPIIEEKEETIEEPVKEEVRPLEQMSMYEYEDEQEEKAIISTEELAKRLNEMKSSSDVNEQDEIDRYEIEQEEKAIISYDELLKRATEGVINYEEKEDLGGLTVSKVDFDKAKEVTFDFKDTEESSYTNPYKKEEDFLSSLKAFRRSL